jgi:hypothetical protein
MSARRRASRSNTFRRRSCCSAVNGKFDPGGFVASAGGGFCGAVCPSATRASAGAAIAAAPMVLANCLRLTRFMGPLFVKSQRPKELKGGSIAQMRLWRNGENRPQTLCKILEFAIRGSMSDAASFRLPQHVPESCVAPGLVLQATPGVQRAPFHVQGFIVIARDGSSFPSAPLVSETNVGSLRSDTNTKSTRASIISFARTAS